MHHWLSAVASRLMAHDVVVLALQVVLQTSESKELKSLRPKGLTLLGEWRCLAQPEMLRAVHGMPLFYSPVQEVPCLCSKHAAASAACGTCTRCLSAPQGCIHRCISLHWLCCLQASSPCQPWPTTTSSHQRALCTQTSAA